MRLRNKVGNKSYISIRDISKLKYYLNLYEIKRSGNCTQTGPSAILFLWVIIRAINPSHFRCHILYMMLQTETKATRVGYENNFGGKN